MKANYNLRAEKPPVLPLKTLLSTFTPGSCLDYDAALCNFFFKKGHISRSMCHLQKVAVSDKDERQRMHGAMQQLLMCVTKSRMGLHEEALGHAQEGLAVFDTVLEELADEDGMTRKGKRNAPWAHEAIRGKLFARECLAIEEEFLGSTGTSPKFGLALPDRAAASPRDSEHGDVITVLTEDELQKRKEKEDRRKMVLDTLNELGASAGLAQVTNGQDDPDADANTASSGSPSNREALQVVDDNIAHLEVAVPPMSPSATEEVRAENLRMAKHYFSDDKKLCNMLARSMRRVQERADPKNVPRNDPFDLESVTSEDRRKWASCARLPVVAHSARMRRSFNGADFPKGNSEARALPLAIRNPDFKSSRSSTASRQPVKVEKKGCPFQNFKEDKVAHKVITSRPGGEDTLRWTLSDFRAETVRLRNRINEKERNDLYDDKVHFSESGFSVSKRREIRRKHRDHTRRNNHAAREAKEEQENLAAAVRAAGAHDKSREAPVQKEEEATHKGRRAKDKNAEIQNIQVLKNILDKSCERAISYVPDSEAYSWFGSARKAAKKGRRRD